MSDNNEQHAVVPVRFEDLPIQDRGERAGRIAENYFTTVETRVDQLSANGLEPEKALALKCLGAQNALVMINGVSGDLTVGMLKKVLPMAGDGGGSGEPEDFETKLGKMRFGYMLIPERKPLADIDVACAYWEAQGFDLACKLGEAVADKYPEWKAEAEKFDGKPVIIKIREAGVSLPGYVQQALDMHAEIAYLQQNDSLPREAVERRVSNLKYHATGLITYARTELFGPENYQKVEAILDYGDGLDVGKGLLFDMVKKSTANAGEKAKV